MRREPLEDPEARGEHHEACERRQHVARGEPRALQQDLPHPLGVPRERARGGPAPRPLRDDLERIQDRRCVEEHHEQHLHYVLHVAQERLQRGEGRAHARGEQHVGHEQHECHGKVAEVDRLAGDAQHDQHRHEAGEMDRARSDDRREDQQPVRKRHLADEPGVGAHRAHRAREPLGKHDPRPECHRDEGDIAHAGIARGHADAEDAAEDEGVDGELRQRMQQRPREAAHAAGIAVEDLAARERGEEPAPAGAHGGGGARVHGDTLSPPRAPSRAAPREASRHARRTIPPRTRNRDIPGSTGRRS